MPARKDTNPFRLYNHIRWELHRVLSLFGKDNFRGHLEEAQFVDLPNGKKDIIPPKGPQYCGLLTGSAALWIKTNDRIGKRMNTQWFPEDIDIAVNETVYDTVVAALKLQGAVEVQNGKRHNGFKYRMHQMYGFGGIKRKSLPRDPSMPPIQVYPVPDVMQSIEKHDIEACRIWGRIKDTTDGADMEVFFCESVDRNKVLERKESYVYGQHRPMGCLLATDVNRCQFLNGIASSRGIEELVRKHPDRCHVGQERIRKYNARGYTLVPTMQSTPTHCPYCGSTDEDLPDAFYTGIGAAEPDISKTLPIGYKKRPDLEEPPIA